MDIKSRFYISEVLSKALTNDFNTSNIGDFLDDGYVQFEMLRTKEVKFEVSLTTPSGYAEMMEVVYIVSTQEFFNITGVKCELIEEEEIIVEIKNTEIYLIEVSYGTVCDATITIFAV